MMCLPVLVMTLVVGSAQAQPKAAPFFPPDPTTLQTIQTKTRSLRSAIDAIPRTVPDEIRVDVEVYAKAVEWIVRHREWLTKDSVQQTLLVLDAGLERANNAKAGKTPWRDVRNKPVIRAYRSKIDGSVQPYSVIVPEGFGNPDQSFRFDIVLHGRDATLTEVKFLAQRENSKPVAKPVNTIVLEPYGRGNNAYRWSGEQDVFEAEANFLNLTTDSSRPGVYPDPTVLRVLRGFSMGGAGTWHIGLHHPHWFSVLGPGAGFTTTHGYIKNLPNPLPDHQERCLRIYDAVRYAENAGIVPVVAYSGEKDPQKAAADIIETALSQVPKSIRMTHLVAPGLEHKMPPEWQNRADEEYRKHTQIRRVEDRTRFVTYTTRYGQAGLATIEGLDRHYEKATIETHLTDGKLLVQTSNVRVIRLQLLEKALPAIVTIDGQDTPTRTTPTDDFHDCTLVKEAGRWKAVPRDRRLVKLINAPEKTPGLQGPIDDAFQNRFLVVPPSQEGWHPAWDRSMRSKMQSVASIWDRYFRGEVLQKPSEKLTISDVESSNLILFGDPASNPILGRILEHLPITWTKEQLVVNGVTYDAATHYPVLIYPNHLNLEKYVVLNSGHTFGETDLKGTNALLYPRLGDWAVFKMAPTATDPTATEVVAAGLFDEFWQFPKKR